MKKSIALLLFLFSYAAEATVILPSFFSDNMVLQQNRNVPFFGESTGTSVTITTSWDNRTYTTSVAKNHWEVLLKTPSYGGPYTITIDDSSKLQLNNVMIGEVWLCSGQSNMQMPLAGWGHVNNFEAEIKGANYPQIRLLMPSQHTAQKPQADFKECSGWQVCNPQNVAQFSATAYFFGRELYNRLHIPIGLINSSWPGTVIEAWTSANALRKILDFDDGLALLGDETKYLARKSSVAKEAEQWEALLERHNAEHGPDELKAATTAFNDASWKVQQLPGLWESSVLPSLDGIVYYRRKIVLPASFAGKEMHLKFLADDDDKVWLNGKVIGQTKGYNVQRNYKIEKGLLKEGENILLIKVFDGGGGGGIYGLPGELVLTSGSESVSLAGEWKYIVGTDLRNLSPKPVLQRTEDMPTAIYNQMIHPLVKTQLAGIIWYQGESNAPRAHQYQTLFPLMINDWRKEFGQPLLPFYYVQLANYMAPAQEPSESEWAELREAQLKALALPRTGMAVAIDIGDKDDIHPKNKQEAGRRLALIALAKSYGAPVEYSGPQYKSYIINNNSVTLAFDFNKGLLPLNEALKGFTISGADRKFYLAEARIVGDKVVVFSDHVPHPVAVRYNWGDNPNGNLSNSAGLPASPFRTDEWPGVTFNKK